MYDERDDARNPITFATFSGLSMRPKGIWRMRRRVNSSPNELPRYVDKVRAFCCRASFADKLTRFGPFSSQCRAGNVKIRRGSWNEELFRVLEGFPDLAHDDEVDACSLK